MSLNEQELQPRIYGYFTEPTQTIPEFDPGLDALCPICAKALDANDVRTISLMVPDDDRSYFYRVHRSCHEPLSKTDRCKVDGRLIDAIYSSRSTN
jgi:hypothetical protein